MDYFLSVTLCHGVEFGFSNLIYVSCYEAFPPPLLEPLLRISNP